MAQNSKIEWTDHTANLWWGCTVVHEGCDNCYAKALDNRYNHENPHWGNSQPRKAVKSVWNDLKKYQAKAAEAGEIHRVFVGSMMDIFETPHSLETSFPFHGTMAGNTQILRNHFFNVVVPQSPNLLFLLLTKRPRNINRFIPEEWKRNPPTNVMFGCSVVNHTTAVQLLPQLLEVNGKKFLSIEPQLNEIDFYKVSDSWPSENHPWRNAPILTGIDWVICGGESGAGKRPFNPDWGRSLRDQCKAANVPFFFKQIDKIQAIPEDLMIREFPKL